MSDAPLPAVPVLVARVSDGEAAVPSRVVSCALCGEDCWLSIYSGDSTLALAAEHGRPVITCMRCMERVVSAMQRRDHGADGRAG